MLVVGGAILAVVLAKRRARRLQDEEDMTYFEKYTGNGSSGGIGGERAGQQSPTNMSFAAGPEDLHDLPATAHAAADAYPDRAMHFGLPAMEGYGQAAPEPMIDFGYGAGAGVDYPPNATPYDHTQYDHAQYNHAQYDHAQYDPGYGAAYGAGYENQQYEPQAQQAGQTLPVQYGLPQQQEPITRNRSPSSPHPYADPSNMAHAVGAPPVQQYYMPRDEVVYTGEAH